jgi:hypothetical protein
MAKSENIVAFLKTDAYGKPLSEIECMRNVRTIKDIPAVGEFTGLVGALGTWISFFQVPKHRPMLLHGCTSITIPEAFIFLDSGQLSGLHEGVAGAAYYSRMIDARYAKGGKPAKSSAVVAMTSLSVAHLAIILFIVLGNVGYYLSRRRKGAQR